MALLIKPFTVLNTTTGQVTISGRKTSSQINNIKSYKALIDDTVERQTIAGTPTTINSSELLYGISHMSTSFIKCVYDNMTNTTVDCIFVPDRIVRITYIGGTTSASNSLIYGFASSNNVLITSITFNVLIAKNTSQTIGDYWDIALPDSTFYPNLYIVIIMLNSAWDSRLIISGNTCSITNIGAPNYCINPSKSNYDVNESHFINIQCVNAIYGVPNRLSIAMEDWIFNMVPPYTDVADRDYNDFIISIGSAMLDDSYVNDTTIS